MHVITCKYCNGEYVQMLYEKTGRCSECGELINPAFANDKPKKTAKYKKSTSIATQSVNNAEKAKRNSDIHPAENKETEIPSVKVIERMPKAEVVSDEPEVKLESVPFAEPIENSGKGSDWDTSQFEDDLSSIGLFSFDEMEDTGVVYSDNSTEEVTQTKTPQISTEVIVEEKSVDSSLSSEIREVEKEIKNIEKADSPSRTIQNEDVLIPKDKQTESEKAESKRSKSTKEEFETEHVFNFNADGFYDDTEPVEPALPDAISKTIFIKAVGVVVALFLIITFLIYYA